MQMRRRDVMTGSAVALTSLVATSRLTAAEAFGFSIIDLKVCGMSAPLALGGLQPRFSWKLISAADDFMQGAYRIMVARSPEDLATQSNLVWDSGRIQSKETFDIPYGGPAAKSRLRYWWCVEAWDKEDKLTARSGPATWETGLLHLTDWSAQWLASEDIDASLDRQAGLHWIDGAERIPADGTRSYRTIFTAARGDSAVLLLSCPGLKSVWLNGKEVKAEDADQASWTTMAAYRLPLRAGRNVIGVSQGRYVSYNVPGSLLAAIIRITDRQGNGRRLTSATGWKASIAAPDGWASPGFDDSAWPAAVEAKRKPGGEPWPAYPAMHLRRGFHVAKALQSARLYATALGCYEPWLNGEKIGDRRMAPESTDPSKRILYQTYDVTSQIRPGANTLGLWVGDGWYGSEFTEGARFAFGPAPCRVLAQLELTYADGSTETIGTGDGWTTAPSAILSSEIYDGEVYDARRERSDWALPGASEEGWRAAERAATPDIPVEPQVAPPIRVTQTIAPVAITQPRPGVYVVDFGQNFAGGRELADELSHRRASNQAVSLRKVAVGNCGKAIARGLCGLLPMHPLLQN